MSPLTHQDLRAVAADIKNDLRELIDTRFDATEELDRARFTAINDRLDVVNNRVAQHERAIALHSDLITRLEQRPQSALTTRDVKYVVTAVTVIGVLAELGQKVFSFAYAALHIGSAR